MDQTRPIPALDHEGPVDGRTRRRTRNRTAVISALLAMIREGDLHPGAAEIAERADLVRTAIDQAFQDAAPLSAVPDVGHGSLAERIDRFVDTRLELFAFVDGTMQLARMRAYSIPSIDEEIAVIAEQFRVQIGEHFATELGTVEHATRELLVDAVLVLTSYDSYTIHLRLLGSSVERIRAAWTTGLTALLKN
jgi:hypothetical protein